MKKKEASVAVKKAKKSAAKKAAAKKPVKKAAKKSPQKSVKKPVKKAVKAAKPARPSAKAKKAVKSTAAPKAKPAKTQPAKAQPTPALKSLQNFLTPLDDRLLVRLSGAEKMTAGGLYIPDTVSDVSGNLRGQVVAVGRGHRDNKGRVRPMDVVIGDHVIFAEFSGSKIKLQNEDFIILREAEVMGIVSK